MLYTWWVISDNEHSKERLTSNDFVNSFHKNFTRAPVCWWKFKLNNTFIYLAALKSWGDWKFAHRRCKNSTQKSYSAAPSSGDNCLLQLCSRSGTLCEKEKWCICLWMQWVQWWELRGELQTERRTNLFWWTRWKNTPPT